MLLFFRGWFRRVFIAPFHAICLDAQTERVVTLAAQTERMVSLVSQTEVC